jgi:hypothetical protein
VVAAAERPNLRGAPLAGALADGIVIGPFQTTVFLGEVEIFRAAEALADRPT